jgi:hypothetical protein
MAAHRFKVGQSLFLTQLRSNSTSSSAQYKVVRLLPPQQDGQNQYRIKGLSESFERIAKETDLSV